MKRVLLLGTALAMIGAFVPTRADATWLSTVPFAMDTASVAGIGDEIGSGYDILTIIGASGMTDADSQPIASLNLNGGSGNCTVCSLTPSGSLIVNLTVGGLTQSATFGYDWSSDQGSDTVRITAPDPITFVDLPGTDGENIEIFFGSLVSLVTNASAPSMSEPLSASFAVPEPFSIAVLGIGLFALGAVRARRA